MLFLSKTDLVQAFDKALQADTECMVAYAVSDNRSGMFDNAETKEKRLQPRRQFR